jgi:hypothetical protein
MAAVPKPIRKKKGKRIPKIAHPKISVLKKELDFIYSWWIRLKDCTVNGYNKCYTCGKIFEVIDLQCGHYWSRANSMVRFDERNTKPQCLNCNCSIFGKGKPQEFALGLAREYGGIVLQELEDKKKEKISWEWIDYQYHIDRYTMLVKEKLTNCPEIRVSEKLRKYVGRKISI